MKRLMLGCLVLVVLVPAVAETASEKPISTPWIGVTGGFGTYAMGDVNDEIRELNALVFHGRLEEVESGASFGVDVGLDVNERWRVGGHYRRFSAGSDIRDAGGSLEYKLPANVFFASMDFFPPTASNVRIGFGASAGVVLAASTIEVAITGLGAGSGDITGSGAYLDAHMTADLPLSRVVVLTPSGGYRHANVAGIDINDEPIYTPEGQKYNIDYSGLFLNVCLRILFSTES